ncbi:MAG: HEAT repeat domain-containing protein [Chlorobi bacterium]|nr:HEAT repeat domain-containing protein [Chlorobiota bacterium]MCI0716349.1 HEAT repeat domain-containing protein [Chlorobiota bacterium]
MPDSLLRENQKRKISKAVRDGNYKSVISILESVKTPHAETAKTKDKRFVLKEIISNLKNKNQSAARLEKAFFSTGFKFCRMEEDVSKQIGVSLIWRGYCYNKEKVRDVLLKISDHPNWEVRESAGGAFANVLFYNEDFYNVLKKWSKFSSPNVRRAVVIGSLGLRDEGNSKSAQKAFKLLEILMYDSSPYVKKNLGPFVLGSYFGNSHPEELFKHLDKWIKINDPHVRWNIAMTFNNSFGAKYPRKALKYLRILSKDKNPVVKRAVKSTLNRLKKANKNISL